MNGASVLEIRGAALAVDLHQFNSTDRVLKFICEGGGLWKSQHTICGR
jgi:hypothetical protein